MVLHAVKALVSFTAQRKSNNKFSAKIPNPDQSTIKIFLFKILCRLEDESYERGLWIFGSWWIIMFSWADLVKEITIFNGCNIKLWILYEKIQNSEVYCHIHSNTEHEILNCEFTKCILKECKSTELSAGEWTDAIYSCAKTAQMYEIKCKEQEMLLNYGFNTLVLVINRYSDWIISNQPILLSISLYVFFF